MPSAKIEFDHRNKALNWVVNCGHRQEGLGVCHEAAAVNQWAYEKLRPRLLGYTLKHRSWLEDKGGQDHSAKVCARPQLRYDVG